MDKCKFLRQKKQVKINGEWVDTRSYRYIPYCDPGKPSVIVKGGKPNGSVAVGVVKYGQSIDSNVDKNIQLDGDGNGYIELESDDCINYVYMSGNVLPSCTVEISGAYISYLIATGAEKLIISCSTYNNAKVGDFKWNYLFHGHSLILKGFDTSNATDLSGLFSTCRNIKTLDVSKIDTSKATDVNHMFNCPSLESIEGLQNLNVSKVTNMSAMFQFGQELTSLNLSSWNTSSVTTMEEMFRSCVKLKSLTLDGWDTSKVTTMKSMFHFCQNLASLNLSNFNTANVTDMSRMFYGSWYGFQSLNLSNFNTANVTDMSEMFYQCYELQSLNLSGWNTSSVTTMVNMFGDCTKLKTIYMRNCSQTTIDRIKAQLTSDGISSQVTIITN